MVPSSAASTTPVIYELTSILDRIDPGTLFPAQQPIELELGSGDGSFLVEYARRHPDRNFFGVERLLGRLKKIERKSRRAGLTNVRAVRIESAYFLRYLWPAHATTALHIYFPDPWPKRKHRRNRLVNEAFPLLAHTVLNDNGTVFLRTDDADYFAQMTSVFQASPLFQLIETPTELAEVVTDFEREFQARGVQTLRAAYKALPVKS